MELHGGYIALISVGGALAAIPIVFFAVKQEIAKRKLKHETRLEEKRIQANLELEKEKVKLQKAKLEADSREKLCKYCGVPNSGSSKFCEGCGSRIFEE